MVKNLPAMQETRVQSVSQEDPLEKEMATHSSIMFLPEFRGQRSLAGYSPRGRKELNRTERLTLSLFTFTVLLLFYSLFFWPHGIWDLVPYQELNPHSCIGRQSLNHRAAKEVPNLKLSLAHVIN